MPMPLFSFPILTTTRTSRLGQKLRSGLGEQCRQFFLRRSLRLDRAGFVAFDNEGFASHECIASWQRDNKAEEEHEGEGSPGMGLPWLAHPDEDNETC